MSGHFTEHNTDIENSLSPYIHFYHHAATDSTRFSNEHMTLNFVIAHQNFKIRTS